LAIAGRMTVLQFVFCHWQYFTKWWSFLS